MDSIFKIITSLFTSLILLLCQWIGIPCLPMGEEVDMTKFTQTFADEFDGELDRSVWSGHYQYGNKTESRKGSYWNQYLAETKDGNLVIPVVYLDDGMGGEGAGWYTAGIDTDDDSPNGFSQKFGYFECRCILPEGACYGNFISNCVTSNLHFDGYNDAHQKMGARAFITPNNPYEEYNTYGLEWNEDEYIFYINGVETFRTNYGGVSQNPEYLILSVEMKGEDGIPSQRENAPADGAEFIVDYVRVYQYNDLLK